MALQQTPADFVTGQQRVIVNPDGSMGVARSQEIDEGYLKDLRTEYDNSQNAPAGNFHRCASIPVELANKWLREGYDVMQEPVAKTIARLRREQLDYFITTKKLG